MLRTILAPLAGVAAAVVVIVLAEMLGHALFPSAVRLDVSDPSERALLIDSLPDGVLIAVAAGWFLGSMAGSGTAMTIARRVLPGWTVGLVIAALGLTTTLMIAHPEWMVAASAVLPLLGVLAARAVLRRRLPAA